MFVHPLTLVGIIYLRHQFNRNTINISSSKTNKTKLSVFHKTTGIVLLLAAITGVYFSFHTPVIYHITPVNNPWADDYSSVAAMEHYKSWVTYNVHDPACKKVGDTYYMYSTDAIFAEKKE